MKTIVISDCHGRPELINNAIEHSGYQENQDKLVFAGDFLDIGPDPLGCLDILEELDSELLWGNHDLARYLRHPIWPQSTYDDPKIHERLCEVATKFKVATCHDGFLVTHAGLSECYDFEGAPINKISDYLNKIKLKEFWVEYSPIWYRPNHYIKPYSGIKQVVGHTPPTSVPAFQDFVSVDPWCPGNFDDPKRFRYAVIKDQKVNIVDSNLV